MTLSTRHVFPLRLTISSGKDNVGKCTYAKTERPSCSWRDQQHDCSGLIEHSEVAEQTGGVQGLLRVRIQRNLANKFRATYVLPLADPSRATGKGLAWPPCVAYLLFCAALELLRQNLLCPITPGIRQRAKADPHTFPRMALVYQRWRTIPRDRISDGTRIGAQI